MHEAERYAAAQRTAGKCGFNDPEQLVGNLSGGWLKRLAIGRAVIQNPDLLLMDEPTSSLDAASRRVGEDAAETASLAGVAVVLISHADYAPRRVSPLELRVGQGSCHLGPAIAPERAREVA